MIRYAAIAPIKYMELTSHLDTHMFLAHMCSDIDYVREAKKLKGFKILDNSYYELKASLSKTTLVDCAKMIDADFIVAPDGEVKEAMVNVFNSRGFGAMLVPKDLKQFERAMQIALSLGDKRCRVGLGHLHAVNMVSLDQYFTNFTSTKGVVKFQPKNRVLALENLRDLNPKLYEATVLSKDSTYLHFLGLGSYPYEEITYLKDMVLNATLDSSAFTWEFLNGRGSWESKGEKGPESKVNFFFESPLSKESIENYFSSLTGEIQ